MTHLELENLASDYLEGQLDQARRAEMEAHLDQCATCREVLSDVRLAIQTCRSVEEMMPPPWLLPRIRLATMGKERTGIVKQVNALLLRIRQPRVAYAVAMTLFSVSLIMNVAGLNLRSINIADLNPAAWVYRANRAGHLFYARAEKFYDDLRIVYEIESRFRDTQSETDQQENQTQKPGPPKMRPSSTADIGGEQMASTVVRPAGRYAQLNPGAPNP